MSTFGQRLAEGIEARGPLCVGIDPHSALVTDWGFNDDVQGLEQFALGATEAIAPEVAIVKPQSAFYERFGSRGIAVLEKVIATAHDAGALVLLDVKRGDIGSTSDAYADAYLNPSSPLAADAITVNPYLGFGSLQPFIDAATKFDAGVFVLALTSNKEGPEVQEAVRVDGRTVAATMLGHLRELNADARPLGSFGAVIGATVTPIDTSTDDAFDFNGPILAPGFGEQGGTVADLQRLFGSARANVLPSTSRGVLRAGPTRESLINNISELRDQLETLRADR